MRTIKCFISAAVVVAMLGSAMCELSGSTLWAKIVSAAESSKNDSAYKEKAADELVFIPEEKYWEYEENEDGEIRITGFDDYDDYEDPDYYGGNYENRQPYQLVIPQTIEGKRVICAGGVSFLRTTRKITSIKVPEGVTEIKQLASRYDEITSVELPTTLETIGQCAFDNCQTLQSIVLPNNLREIEHGAFRNCQSLQSIELPDSLTRIESEAFYGCFSLKCVRIPANTTWIYETAFADCRGMEAFEVDSANSSYISENGILIYRFTEKVPIYGEEVDEDGDPVVASWKEVEKKRIISYPGAKKGECYLEENMDFAETAFLNIDGLTAINADPANSEYTSVEGIVYTKDMKTLLVCPSGKSGEYTVPEGVYSLQSNAFSRSSLNTIHFPDSLCAKYTTEYGKEEEGYIGSYCFYETDSVLHTISLGKNITEKAIRYFLKSTNLKNITISEENENICCVDNVIYDKAMKTLIGIAPAKTGKLVLPDTVETSKSLVEGNGITEIVLGKNYQVTVKTLYDEEYRDENGNLIQEDPYTVLQGLPSLPSLQAYYVSEDNTTLASYDGLLYSRDMKTVYQCPAKKKGAVEIREGSVTIGRDSFEDYFDDYKEEDAVIIIPASVTDIQWDMYSYIDSDTIIKGYRGSAAEKYANARGLTFVELGDAEVPTTPAPATPEPTKPSTEPSALPVVSPSVTPGSSSTPKPTTDIPVLKEDSPLTITEEGNLTGLIQNKNSVQEIREQFAGENVVIKDATGKVLAETDILGTGATVSVMDGDTVKASCQVVLIGDVNGDGKVNGKDVSMLARSLVGKATLTDVQKEAAEVLVDGAINGKDVSKLARSLVGKATISSQAK